MRAGTARETCLLTVRMSARPRLAAVHATGWMAGSLQRPSVTPVLQIDNGLVVAAFAARRVDVSHRQASRLKY